MDYDIAKFSDALKVLQAKYVNEKIPLDSDNLKEFDEGFAKFLRIGRYSVPSLDSIALDDSVDPLIIQTAWQIAHDIKNGIYPPEFAAREIVYFSIFLLKVGNKEEGSVSTSENFKDDFTESQEENFFNSWNLGFEYISKGVKLADLTPEEKETYIDQVKELLEASSNATQLRIKV